MTDRQNSTINMMEATNAVLRKYKAVWSSRKTFSDVVDILEQVLKDLEDPIIARGKDTSGIADNKSSAQLRAAEKADYIGDIIQAYALDKGDMELYRAMMFSAAEIAHMAATESHAKMMEVHAKGAELFTALQDYGLEQADLDDLHAGADAFDKQKTAPRSAIIEKKEAGNTIGALLTTGVAALHRLDKMIATFGKASPQFVSEFGSARIMLGGKGGAKLVPADKKP